MFYALVYYPDIDVEHLNQIRRKYDPTVDVIDPHITIMFAVPESIGEQQLVDHLDSILDAWQPFPIRMCDFHRSSDHWLFLTLSDGKSDVVNLYRSIYTDILADFRRHDIDFVPHLALGLFIKDNEQYDWNNPRESDFDEHSFSLAMRETEGLNLDITCLVDKLHLVKVANEVFEWATGKRPSFSTDTRAIHVKTFPLGERTA